MLTLALALTAAQPAPISLHPGNPRYFLFRGKPTVLITSGEHYGAVLNLDFDYGRYLKTLEADGLNLTRLFSGTYREVPGSFKIAENTLAPKRYLAPWVRTDTPGTADGGGKWDLARLDDAYFARLKDFCAQAGRCGIVVEVVLFCPFYGEELWKMSPMNAANNVNGIGAVPRTEALSLKHPDLVAVQEAFVRRTVTELRDLDNIYYEICNEPYIKDVPLDWQHRIADVIVETESSFPHKHLIAQNIANGSAKVENPHPAVSVFNFHYASPPEAVRVNYALAKPIAFDESGFKGRADATYRAQAWEFLLAGGSVFSHLDYSFTASHPDGTFQYPPEQPGGGGPALRRQLRILKEFVEGFDFLRMAPDAAVVQGVPEGVRATALSQPGETYAVYLKGGTGAELGLALPAGHYQAEWLNPVTGAIDKREALEHAGGAAKLQSPAYAEDIALRIRRV